jgi:hypothetical protein
MLKPGFSRGLSMGFVGFIVGVLFVLLLRSLQSMDPLWDAGVTLAIAPFICLGFFLWGVGAFDPRMNQHVHQPLAGEEVLPVEEEEEVNFDMSSSRLTSPIRRLLNYLFNEMPMAGLMSPPWKPRFFLLSWIVHIIWFIIAVALRVLVLLIAIPLLILGMLIDVVVWLWRALKIYNVGIWQVATFGVVSFLVLLFAANLLTGVQLVTTGDPSASAFEFGYAPLEINGEMVQVSQIIILLIFLVVLFVTLAIVTSILMLVVYGANRSINEVKQVTTTSDMDPRSAEDIGGFFNWIGNVLASIPGFLGQK